MYQLSGKFGLLRKLAGQQFQNQNGLEPPLSKVFDSGSG